MTALWFSSTGTRSIGLRMKFPFLKSEQATRPCRARMERRRSPLRRGEQRSSIAFNQSEKIQTIVLLSTDAGATGFEDCGNELGLSRRELGIAAYGPHLTFVRWIPAGSHNRSGKKTSDPSV
jgi:hypothetical protein